MLNFKLIIATLLTLSALQNVASVDVTMCTDDKCSDGCVTNSLDDNGYTPEGTKGGAFWSVKIENPDQPTNLYVTKHHFCSYYGGNDKRRNPQQAALIVIDQGDNGCKPISDFGQNGGKTPALSACVANPNRLRPGDDQPPDGVPPADQADGANQP